MFSRYERIVILHEEANECFYFFHQSFNEIFFQPLTLKENSLKQVAKQIYASTKTAHNLHCVRIKDLNSKTILNLNIPLVLKFKIIRQLEEVIKYELCWDC